MSKGILGLLDFYYEYPIARMLGDEHVYVFKYGTLGGLINLQKQDKIGLLAIRNLEPHNGQFIKFIEMVEDFARKNHLDIVVEYLMNDRLDKWFERRSYEKFGEHRILRYQRRQNENTNFIDMPMHYEYDVECIYEGKYATVENGWDIHGVYENVPLEQDTGLKDKNGNSIWEGDIVEGTMGVFEVKWDDTASRFGFEPNMSMDWHPAFVCDQVNEMEVIGNIHENPELLEKK